jgi:hypothetical protein
MSIDPTGFYANLRNKVASPLIQEYGFQGSVWVKSAEVFDPVAGAITSPAVWGQNPCFAVYGGGKTGKYPGVAIKTDPKTLTRVRTKEMFADAVALGTVVPAPDDLFEDEQGNLFEIMEVEMTNPGGVTLLYNLTVKL